MRRRLAFLMACEDGQAMVEYGAIAATLIVALALAVKGVQIALSRSLAHAHQGFANAP